MYKITINPFCHKHFGRIRRYGHAGINKTAWQCVEKLPHKFVDSFIRRKCKTMIDKEMAEALKSRGVNGATIWTVKYRRRKLGIKKYLYGEIQKHKAWIRAQAIKKYGTHCELCNYNLSVDTHHILPKYRGGLHEIENLMVICQNCHALITRKIINLDDRTDIPRIRGRIIRLLKEAYSH